MRRSGSAPERGWRVHVDDSPARQILQRSDRLDHALFAVGIEILPYELVGVITDFDGTRKGSGRWPLPGMEVETVVDQVAAFARYLVDASLGLDLPNPRVCLGLQLGGPVDHAMGMVRFYSNGPDDHTKRRAPYQWENVKLVDLVQIATGCVTVLENDAHAYAAYEQKLGLGCQTDSFALVLVRDGVGGAVVVDHQLLAFPLEFGHIPVWPKGRECDCGKYGCVESQAGRRAIRAMVAELTGLENVDPFERAVKIADGDDEHARAAQQAFLKAGESVARGIATILTLFGLRDVVLYGPDALIGSDRGSQAANCFMGEVKKFREHTFRVVEQCRLITEPLNSEHAFRGAQGAALTALNRQFFVPLGTCLEHSS